MEIKEAALEWKPAIVEILNSKYTEFQLLGYDIGSKEEIWTCLTTKIWNYTYMRQYLLYFH